MALWCACRESRISYHESRIAQRSRAGQYSIRVNDQFRLCFRWTAAGPEDVEIVDYH